MVARDAVELPRMHTIELTTKNYLAKIVSNNAVYEPWLTHYKQFETTNNKSEKENEMLMFTCNLDLHDGWSDEFPINDFFEIITNNSNA